jgi:signal transduction histidine kinase
MSDRSEQWKGDRAINGLILLILVGVLLRSLGAVVTVGEPLRWLSVALMALFSLFLLLTFWPRINTYINPTLYFIIQSAIAMTLMLLFPERDYYAVFFGILSVQVTRIYPRNVALRWIGLFTIAAGLTLIYNLGWPEALPFVVLYAALFFALSYFVVLKNQAETAQRDSQFLLEELRKAHETLQEHAVQIEELAVLEERNRLARDLHDSVTQSLYSLTLFAQAARDRASAGELEQTERSLARVADTAAQALKEMRLLVYELRPSSLEDVSLAEALERRLEVVEKRSGVKTGLIVDAAGDLQLADNFEDELYHICQEALNNSLKHAQATSVTIRLSQSADGKDLRLEIIDNGSGFDLNAAKENGGLGLLSMAERVDNLGGTLALETSPGKGTHVTVDLELAA